MKCPKWIRNGTAMETIAGAAGIWFLKRARELEGRSRGLLPLRVQPCGDSADKRYRHIVGKIKGEDDVLSIR